MPDDDLARMGGQTRLEGHHGALGVADEDRAKYAREILREFAC